MSNPLCPKCKLLPIFVFVPQEKRYLCGLCAGYKPYNPDHKPEEVPSENEVVSERFEINRKR